MRRSFIFFAAAAIFASGYFLARAETDSSPPLNKDASKNTYQASEHLRIAVVDVAAIFKGCNRLTAKNEEMKKKADAIKQQLTDKAKEVQEMVDRDKGAPKEIASTDRITQLQNILNGANTAARDELEQQQGTLYYETMQVVNREIASCADRHGINLVLRVNREPVNPKDRNDILRGVNAPIPYFQSSLDITDEVLAAVNAE